VTEEEISVRPAEPGDHAAWEDYCRRTPGAELGHLWSYHDLLVEVFGFRVVRLMARRGPVLIGVLPLVFQHSVLGRFLTSVPYLNYAGVLGQAPEGREALAAAALELARSLHADRLELRGRKGQDLPIEVWPGKATYVLDLPRDAETLWAGLGAKLRSQVKRPQKEGYTTRFVGRGGHAAFYPLLARRWHELGSPVLPRRFFQALEDLGPASVDYAQVERDGQPVAIGLLLGLGGRIEIAWAASDGKHDRYGVNMLLYWSALERAITSGAEQFDFGRSTPGTGSARFKLQWGPREEPLEWSVRSESRRGRSTERGDGRRGLGAAAWRRLPAFLARRFGPIVAARIPL